MTTSANPRSSSDSSRYIKLYCLENAFSTYQRLRRKRPSPVSEELAAVG